MSNVLSIPSTAARRSRGEKGGLLRVIAAVLRRDRSVNELRGLSDRHLRDIGLARRDVAKVEWPSRGATFLMPPDARP